MSYRHVCEEYAFKRPAASSGIFSRMTSLCAITTIIVLATVTLAADAPTDYTLDFTTPTDLKLQEQLTRINESIRAKIEMTPAHTAVGLLDLSGPSPRLAMLNPDRETYA